MRQIIKVQREINKPFLYGIGLFLVVTSVLNLGLAVLNQRFAGMMLFALIACWFICPILLFPAMAIRFLRFVHQVGAPFRVQTMMVQLASFFGILYSAVTLIVVSVLLVNAQLLPVGVETYVRLFNFHEVHNLWYWLITFFGFIASGLVFIYLITLVYMLFRSQLLNHYSWWKKLSVLIAGALVIFVLISRVLAMVAAIFPTIPLVPGVIVANDEVIGEFSTSFVQVSLQFFYIYVLVNVNTYVYQHRYESEY